MELVFHFSGWLHKALASHGPFFFFLSVFLSPSLPLPLLTGTGSKYMHTLCSCFTILSPYAKECWTLDGHCTNKRWERTSKQINKCAWGKKNNRCRTTTTTTNQIATNKCVLACMLVFFLLVRRREREFFCMVISSIDLSSFHKCKSIGHILPIGEKNSYGD